MRFDDLGTKAKTGYVRTVRLVDARLGHDLTPPDTRYRTRRWIHSLAAIHDTDRLMALDVPWWTYRAVDAVGDWLAARSRPIRIFEYGSGASSTWLARRSDEVYSVEHDPAFATLIAPSLEAAGATLITAPPVSMSRPTTASAKAGQQGLDFTSYVGTIEEIGGTFDLIVIDGRARTACLAASLGHLASDGVIVFDNSLRRRYRRAILDSGLTEERLFGLTPSLPYPECTSILSR